MLWSVKEPKVASGKEIRRSVRDRYAPVGLAVVYNYGLNTLAVLSPFAFWAIFKHLPGYLEADHRLAPTFALVSGYRVYYPADAGPVLSTLYGPVMPLFYLPTTMANSPAVAILIGTVMTIGIVYCSAVFAIHEAAGSFWMKNWQLLVLTIAVFTLLGPLQSASSHIHADAPALGFGAIATVFGMRSVRKRWQDAMFSGLFSALSVLAKQTMLPLVFAVAAWWLLTSGWKKCVGYLASVGCAGAVVLAVTIPVLGSSNAAYFNCISVPLHQPFDRTQLLPALNNFTILSVVLLSIPCGRIVKCWRHFNGIGIPPEFLLSQKSLLLVLVGFLLAPTAILGRLKIGGNDNSLALSLFFFALALLAEISALRVRSEVDLAWIEEVKIWSLPLLAAGGIALASSAYLSLRQPPPENRIQQAFEYAKRHPDTVYFPQFPLAHLMAEGKLYHFSWGLMDRQIAGNPVSTAHFNAHIPVRPRIAAMTGFVPHYDKEIIERLGPRLEGFPDSGELDGFDFYALKR